MFSWAVTFLIIAIIAGVLGLTGIAGVSMEIAWTLFVVGLIVAIVFFVLGKRAPPPWFWSSLKKQRFNDFYSKTYKNIQNKTSDSFYEVNRTFYKHVILSKHLVFLSIQYLANHLIVSFIIYIMGIAQMLRWEIISFSDSKIPESWLADKMQRSGRGTQY